MPIRLRQSGIAESAQGLGDLPATIASSSEAALNGAAKAVAVEAARYTASVYNLDVETLAQYIAIKEATKGSRGVSSASVTLRSRAIPIEAFKPQIRMQLFNFVDARGRHVSRLLPAVYLARFRNASPRYISVAFPLTTRSSGSLAAGDRIRRRTGKDRGKLTRLRYFTFPKEFTQNDLLPHLLSFAGETMRVSLRAQIRAYSKRGLRELKG